MRPNFNTKLNYPLTQKMSIDGCVIEHNPTERSKVPEALPPRKRINYAQWTQKWAAILPKPAEKRPKLTRNLAIEDLPPNRPLGPPNALGVQMCEPFDLFDFQLDMVKWMLHMESRSNLHSFFTTLGYLLCAEMGLGKTVSILTVILYTLLHAEVKLPTLYVCPKSVLSTVLHEIRKFFGSQLRAVIYHRGKPDLTPAAILQNYDVIITNYGTVSSASAAVLSTVKWARVVLDESHEIRTKSTKRFQSIAKIESRVRVCMTGTPIYNDCKDLFTQLDFCGLKLPRKFPRRNKTLELFGFNDVIKYVTYNQAVETVTLPPKETHYVRFDLSPTERRLHEFYMQRVQEMIIELENETVNLKKLLQTNKANTAFIRVLQLCSAPYLLRNENPNPWMCNRIGEAGLQSSKLRAFRELITQSLQSSKTVIFAVRVEFLKLAVDVAGAAQSVLVTGDLNAKERDRLFRLFRTDPAKKFLFMTIQLGVGLNIVEATNVVFLELWYNHSSHAQGESRVHRIGQVKPVNVYYFVGNDSLEEKVLAMVQSKKSETDDVKQTQLNAQQLKALIN